jgi:RNA polymerase sigma-70 factor (ECF subfamily)
MHAQLESDLPGPEEAVLAGEVQSAVRRAVDSLSAEHRLVVTMHHMEGLDVESVAKILNLPRGTVMSRLSRAREAIRRKLSGYVEVHDHEHE